MDSASTAYDALVVAMDKAVEVSIQRGDYNALMAANEAAELRRTANATIDAMIERNKEVLNAADDEAFWEELDRMTGELRDSHTRVESPRRVEARRNNEGVTLGLAFVVIDGALVVSSVNTGSDAWWAGVRPGMTVLTIDGIGAMDAYRKLYAETRDSSS